MSVNSPSQQVPASAQGAAAPPAPSRAARIWRRTIVGLSIASVVGLILWSTYLPQGPWIAVATGLVLSLGCIYEVGRMGILGRRAFAAAGVGACVATLAMMTRVYAEGDGALLAEAVGLSRYFGALGLATLAGIAVLVAGLFASGARGHGNRGRSSALLWAAWAALPMTGLVPVRIFMGASGLVAVVLLSKVGDIVGYYVGSWIGKSHPFPRISPGKTTAGCVGSLVAGTLFGYACAAMGLLPEPRFGLASALLAGASINLASQAGDLLESVAKRRCKIKDSGSLFGPSGGFLDVLDSLLLSLPVALLTWPLLFHLPYAAAGF